MKAVLQAAAEVQEFVQEVVRCQKLPEGQKPDRQQWQGSWQQRLQAVQAFALDTADTAQSALAIQSVQVGCMLEQRCSFSG